MNLASFAHGSRRGCTRLRLIWRSSGRGGSVIRPEGVPLKQIKQLSLINL